MERDYYMALEKLFNTKVGNEGRLW